MTDHDRTHAIIACMRDLAIAHYERMDDRTRDLDEGDLPPYAAIGALNLAHDDVAAFALWPLTGADEMIAAGLWRFLRGKAPRFTSVDDATRAQRVAMRFAVVAIAAAPGLGDPPAEIRWLWNAAGRLASLASLGGEAYADLPVIGARPVQVGDIIDAKDVPPGTLVDRQTPDGPLLTIRLPNGRGYHLTPDDERCESWPWQERGSVRVLATDIRGVEADRVAMMSPAKAREWLAQRVASEAV